MNTIYSEIAYPTNISEVELVESDARQRSDRDRDRAIFSSVKCKILECLKIAA